MKKYLFLFLLPVLFSCNAEKASKSVDFKNASVSELPQLLRDGHLLLDVRTADEIKTDGGIAHSVNIDYHHKDFEKQITTALTDKNRGVVIYCARGSRSAETCQLLAGKGYSKVYNLEGGYAAWQEFVKSFQ